MCRRYPTGVTLPHSAPYTAGMDLREKQEGPIAVYGATGFTGKLVARELEKNGADFLLAGRNPEKLDRLAAELESDPPRVAVQVDDPKGLRDLLDGCSTVIACAGPFTLLGEPVLAAAVDTGTNYLDTTGEQSFIAMAYDRYGRRAEQAGIAVIPGMGFDYVPGDMIASLTAMGVDDVETVRLAYATDFQMTRGTMLSALEMIKGGDLEWRDGRLVPADPSVDRGAFDFGAPMGEVQMTRYPAGEHLTVPRHIETDRVETMLSAGSIAPAAFEKVTPYVARPLGILMRTPVRSLTGRLVGRLPEGPTPESRAQATFTVCCEVAGHDRTHRGRISGRDVYGITAALIVKGAIEAAVGDIERSGGLAPSEAFDPALFLDGFEDFSLEWSVDTDAS